MGETGDRPIEVGDMFYCIGAYSDDIWRACCNGYSSDGEGGLLVVGVYGITWKLGFDAFVTREEAEEAIERRRANA